MSLSAEEEAIHQKALSYARSNKKDIAKRFTDTQKFPPEEHPVSVFMAGSPGAGKTESSIELLSKFSTPVIRIDIDELRSEFEGYTGSNAYLFQAAAAVLLERIHDMALDQRQSFILDGTLSRYDIAEKNIRRSLDKGRTVQILYTRSPSWLGILCRRERPLRGEGLGWKTLSTNISGLARW